MLFSAFTTRKMQNATMTKLMTIVTKFPPCQARRQASGRRPSQSPALLLSR